MDDIKELYAHLNEETAKDLDKCRTQQAEYELLTMFDRIKLGRI